MTTLKEIRQGRWKGGGALVPGGTCSGLEGWKLAHHSSKSDEANKSGGRNQAQRELDRLL